jgi:hypothetical protein
MSRDTPPDGWQYMAKTNPNHPWVGGPQYVNVETGESRDAPPDGWLDIVADMAQMKRVGQSEGSIGGSLVNRNHPWNHVQNADGSRSYVNSETGERQSYHPHGWQHIDTREAERAAQAVELKARAEAMAASGQHEDAVRLFSASVMSAR